MDKTTTFINGSDSAIGRALSYESGAPGSSPTSAKNCKFFFYKLRTKMAKSGLLRETLERRRTGP